MAEKSWGTFPKPTEDEIKTIITKDEGVEILVKYADNIGKALANQLTTNQIRAIFGEVRRIQGEWKTKPDIAKRNLILLKPKMAYRARKERGRAVGDLVSVLSPAIDFVQGDIKSFTRFVEFFEAILAYHKAYGGN
ncbi:MAG: type III-A CRISPR-associated protein Csm2 [Anaerolineales bacterium]|nr:type III-A CRISPR-associated protein Csm2 [Anaerolineales bacterium]